MPRRSRPGRGWRALVDAAAAAEPHATDGGRRERKREKSCRHSSCQADSRCSDCTATGGSQPGRTSRWRERSSASGIRRRFREPGDALRYFRRLARFVIICGKWISPMTRQRDQQLRSFVDVAKELEGSMRQRQLDTAGAVFNRADYSPEKELTISKDVERLLQLRKEDRTDEMIKQMVISLRTLQAFAEYPVHIQEQLCRVAQYHLVPPGRIILRAGHRGECFYIVISGRGQVKAVTRSASTGEVMMDSVSSLKRGQKFGDEALLRGVDRTATVESVTTMKLLAIEKSDFAEIFMKENAERKEPEFISFLRKVDFLKYFPLQYLKTSGESCIFQYFSAGKVVVADSLASDYIYIVKSGSCTVLKRLRAQLGLDRTAQTKARSTPAAATCFFEPARQRRVAFTSIVGEDTDGEDSSSDSAPRRRPPRWARTESPAPPKTRVKVRSAHDSDGGSRRGSLTGGDSDSSGGRGSGSERTELHPYTPTIAVPRFELPPLKNANFSDDDEDDDDVVRELRRQAAAARFPPTAITNGSHAHGDDRRWPRRNACSPFQHKPSDGRRRLCSPPAKPPRWPIQQGAAGDGLRAAAGRVRPLTDAPRLRRSSDRAKQADIQPAVAMERARTELTPSAAVVAAAARKPPCGGAKRHDRPAEQLSGPVAAAAAVKATGGFGINETESKSTATTRVTSRTRIGAEGRLCRRSARAARPVGADRSPESGPRHLRTAFVQLAILKPTDAFGLDTLAFDPHFRRSEISVSLVSNGAELILMSKRFFLQHCTEATLGHLRVRVAPSPTERQLQSALGVLLDWDAYRKGEVARLVATDSRGVKGTGGGAHKERYARELLPALLQRYTF